MIITYPTKMCRGKNPITVPILKAPSKKNASPLNIDAISNSDKEKRQRATGQYRRQGIRHQSCSNDLAWMFFTNFSRNAGREYVEERLEIPYKINTSCTLILSQSKPDLPLLQSSYSHWHPQSHFLQTCRPIAQEQCYRITSSE